MATYLAIKELSEENKEYPILELCKLGKVSRAAYYKWLNRVATKISTKVSPGVLPQTSAGTTTGMSTRVRLKIQNF